MRIQGKDIWPLTKETFSSWLEHKAPKMAAALATYAMLSLAPLLVIVTKIVGIYYRKGAGEKIASTLQDVLPGVGGEAVRKMIEVASQPGQGTIATVLSILVAAYGATGVFGELQDSMNTIWEVKPKPFSVWGWLRARFLSFATVLGIAFLFMVSTVGSAAVTALGKRLGGEGVVALILTHVVSLAVMTVLFALIFWLLPDVKMRLADVWVGAVLSAVLFELGKVLLAIYIAGSATKVFGAAGSLAALLLWVYYSAQILFFGAEFTRASVRRYGAGAQVDEHAVKMTEEDKAKQGRPSEGRVAAKTAQAGGRPFRTRTPSAAIPAYSMAPVDAGDGGMRRVAIVGAGVVVGAVAGALGATAMAKETKRPVRKHLAAVKLDERLKNVEQRVGKISRIHQYLQDATVYDRINAVQQRIRHARGVLRAEENRRPNWLVRLGDAIAGNKN